jgi:cell wall-associated NlpC family hydrolase
VKPKPKPTVSSVEATLAKLAKQNTQLVEKYDQAQVAVAAAQRKSALANGTLKVADASVAQAGVELSRSALAEYEGGSFSTAGALLSSSGGTSYLDTLDTMQMISTHSAQVVSAYTLASQSAAKAKQQADAALSAATKTRDALVAQQKVVRAQVKKYSTLLTTLTAAQRATFQNRMNPAATAAQRQAVQMLLPTITSAQVRQAVKFALLQVGKPYSWGAAGPGSYDCSGLTMAAYHSAGINLPHSAAQQYNYGHHVSFAQLQPGDLMFFYRPTIGHVTMYVGDGMMVSAPETGELVKVMPADSFGSDFVGATRLVSG